MTAQFSDFARYRDQNYALAGVNGRGLFRPQDYGINPIPACTACYRGFVCGYAVVDDQLLLDGVRISLAADAQAPPLFGAQPKPSDDRFELFSAVYEQVAQPLEFTGGILLARKFIDILYVHMGYHPAWKFREVHELIFENGRLVQAEDRSAAMVEARKHVKKGTWGPELTESPEVFEQWLARCFSLSY